MFGVDDVLLATLAAQVGSAAFNCIRGNKHSKELAAKQQAYEEKVTREGIQNAREEFAALCSLQREIESDIQRDRIDMIKSNHANAILEKAYSVALDKWPLLVPPYVVKNECLLNLEQSRNEVLPLNCIMTTSMDSNFNKSIFPNMEESIAEFCYNYWNVASDRGIRFYQRAWKDNITDIGAECRNLHALMKDVPTLVLSPQVRHGKLTFRFFWWGVSINPQDVHIDDNSIFDPELSNPVYEGMKYSDDDIRIILSELIPKLEAFVSYFADLYYWHYLKMTPILPTLLKSNDIVQSSNLGSLIATYINGMLDEKVLSSVLLSLYGEKFMELIKFLPQESQRKMCIKILRRRCQGVCNIENMGFDDIIKLDLFSNKDIPFWMSIKDIWKDKINDIDTLIDILQNKNALSSNSIDKDKKYNSGYAIIVSKEQNKKTQKPKYKL